MLCGVPGGGGEPGAEREGRRRLGRDPAKDCLPGSAGGPAPRPDEGGGEGADHGRLCPGPGGCAGGHYRHRGWRGCAQCYLNGDRGRGPVRSEPAPSAPGPGGPGQRQELLHPHLPQPQSGDPAAAEGPVQNQRRLQNCRRGPEDPGPRRLLRLPSVRPSGLPGGGSIYGHAGPDRCPAGIQGLDRNLRPVRHAGGPGPAGAGEGPV